MVNALRVFLHNIREKRFDRNVYDCNNLCFKDFDKIFIPECISKSRNKSQLSNFCLILVLSWLKVLKNLSPRNTTNPLVTLITSPNLELTVLIPCYSFVYFITFVEYKMVNSVLFSGTLTWSLQCRPFLQYPHMLQFLVKVKSSLSLCQNHTSRRHMVCPHVSNACAFFNFGNFEKKTFLLFGCNLKE